MGHYTSWTDGMATVYDLAGKLRNEVSSSQNNISACRVKILLFNFTQHFPVYHHGVSWGFIKFHEKILKIVKLF